MQSRFCTQIYNRRNSRDQYYLICKTFQYLFQLFAPLKNPISPERRIPIFQSSFSAFIISAICSGRYSTIIFFFSCISPGRIRFAHSSIRFAPIRQSAVNHFFCPWAVNISGIPIPIPVKNIFLLFSPLFSLFLSTLMPRSSLCFFHSFLLMIFFSCLFFFHLSISTGSYHFSI